mmetsp:Transcript_16992/g.46381  ORF Transcript_16992/g.46381 Transcript_16992/m.46381 type:complete len:282 (-) Transcript_16992:152-997(-)
MQRRTAASENRPRRERRPTPRSKRKSVWRRPRPDARPRRQSATGKSNSRCKLKRRQGRSKRTLSAKHGWRRCDGRLRRHRCGNSRRPKKWRSSVGTSRRLARLQVGRSVPRKRRVHNFRRSSRPSKTPRRSDCRPCRPPRKRSVGRKQTTPARTPVRSNKTNPASRNTAGALLRRKLGSGKRSERSRTLRRRSLPIGTRRRNFMPSAVRSLWPHRSVRQNSRLGRRSWPKRLRKTLAMLLCNAVRRMRVRLLQRHGCMRACVREAKKGASSFCSRPAPTWT